MPDKKILDFYLQTSSYTDTGLYGAKLKKALPDNVREIGLLIRNNITHRKVLENHRSGVETAPQYGDMTKVPWYRQPEDDIYITAAAMLNELFRRDKKGLHMKRKEADRLVVTCRYVSVLYAALLKLKGIPARVRSGFAPYVTSGKKSADHWTVEYWNYDQNRWAMADVDASLEGHITFDPYDVPLGTFDFSANAWLESRKGRMNPSYFWNASNHDGLMVISWELFYDFHCLMNSEIIYLHVPEFIYGQFDQLAEKDLEDIDQLAVYMQKPDEHFDKLQDLWEKEQKYRVLKGGLL